MIHELSVLIPCYNSRCRGLVKTLSVLLKKEEYKGMFHYEVLVADDGSTDKSCVEYNKAIDSLNNCQYIIREKNVGRAAIRNFLAQEAKYEWLLFIDCDMVVRNEDYIKQYINSYDSPVMYGGYSVRGNRDKLKGNLRFVYEKKCETTHIYTERQKNPYKDFHTSNFLVKRDIMLAYPLDERFRHYGYEDVLWGKTLKDNNIGITHINNPLSFEKFESNTNFISKTEEGLTTLFRFRKELEEYSNIICYAKKLRKFYLIPFIALIHKISSKYIKCNLQGNNPSLLLFNIYKICVFCNFLNKNNS